MKYVSVSRNSLLCRPLLIHSLIHIIIILFPTYSLYVFMNTGATVLCAYVYICMYAQALLDLRIFQRIYKVYEFVNIYKKKGHVYEHIVLDDLFMEKRKKQLRIKHKGIYFSFCQREMKLKNNKYARQENVVPPFETIIIIRYRRSTRVTEFYGEFPIDVCVGCYLTRTE